MGALGVHSAKTWDNIVLECSNVCSNFKMRVRRTEISNFAQIFVKASRNFKFQFFSKRGHSVQAAQNGVIG